MVKYNVHVIPFRPAAGIGRVCTVYYFLSARGENVIREWLDAEKIQKDQRAIFQQKIDALERGGPELVPGLLFPVAKDIYKAKIKGNKGQKQLRPRLCRGPFGESEFTFLAGAIEKDKKDIPSDVNQRAHNNRDALLAAPTRRRRERIAP